jgi:hypothetical protein
LFRRITEDYLPSAVGVPADGYGRYLDGFGNSPQPFAGSPKALGR